MAAARLLDGVALARKLEPDLAVRTHRLRAAGVRPCLAAVLFENDRAGHAYAMLKRAAGERTGVLVRVDTLPADAGTARVVGHVNALNRDAAVHGILVQLPLPDRIDASACLDAIDELKDVDGGGARSLGRLVTGAPGFRPATAAGAMRLLAAHVSDLAGRGAIVVGTGPALALPLALLLLEAGATVTVCPPDAPDLRERLAAATIVAAAADRPGAIPADWLPDGAVVIDGGYTNPGGIGDVGIDGALHRIAAYVPVPGGVGPMTIAMLLEHTVQTAERLMHPAQPDS